MAFAQLSRVRLEYFEFGHGPEKVLFIHGFQASARIWHKVQQLLPADQYTTIAINNRGAGQSEAPPKDEDYGVEIFAADAFEWVQQKQWQNFTLVGHSLGGVTGAQFAITHGALLKGMVLLDPADPEGRALEPERVESIISERMSLRRQQLAKGGGGDGIDARASVDDPIVQALLADIAAAPEQRLRGSLRSMFRVRLGAAVQQLTVPVLVMCGDSDALIPLPNLLATWARYPSGTGLHVWHGLGHSPNLEAPEAFVEVLRHFIEVSIPHRARAALQTAER